MFWIFNYIFFGLAPLVQIRTGLMPSTTANVLPQFDERAMLVILASLVAFEIGGKLAASRPAPTDPPRQPAHVSARVVVMFCWGGLLLAWAYLLRVGISNVTASRFVHFSARSIISSDPAIVETAYAVAFVPLLVGAHLLLLSRTRPDLVTAPSTRWALILLVFPTLAVVINPFGSARFVFGFVWLSVLAQARVARTVPARRAFALAITVGFLFVFPIADKFSRPNSRGKGFRALEVFQGNGDYDAFAQTNNALHMSARVDLSYGRQFLGVLFFWVPRSIWSGKPNDTGIEIAKFMGYTFTNLSAPLVSELYVNGGILLVVAGFAELGYLMSRPHGSTPDARSAALCVVACVMPFYSPILLRGSLLQATGVLALFGFCMLALRLTAKESDQLQVAIEMKQH